MGAPLEPLQITTNDLIKLFRKWGWQNVGEGVKQVRFKKDRASITIKRSKDPKGIPAEPANEAAIHEGISLTQWLQGPTEVAVKSEIDQDDLDWFLRVKIENLTDREERSRYRHIRHVLTKEGTLNKYLKIAEDMVTTTMEFQQGQENPAAKKAPIEPLPVEVDMTGYISLDEALKIVGLRQTKTAYSACEMIALLAEGDIEDPKGKATPLMLSRLKTPDIMGKPAAATRLKLWETKGLIWREMPHSRSCSKIGLCMPVKLTGDERLRYLAEPYNVTGFVPPEPSEPLVEDSVEVGEVEGDSTRPPSPAASPEPFVVPADFQAAIDVLEERMQWHLDEAMKLSGAIEVLKSVPDNERATNAT